MKVKSYEILDRAIDEGISAGLLRAHKHTQNPTNAHIASEIHEAVMLNISEVFHFDDEDIL